MHKLIALFAATWMVLAGLPAAAMEMKSSPQAVMELFTSQGCSSCPPADALLAEMADRPDILALAYHVDYWDYIGWPDTFGSKRYSNLQRAYAKAMGARTVYTPQVIVNGTDDVVGSRRDEVITALKAGGLSLSVGMHIEGDILAVDVESAEAAESTRDAKDAVLWLVTFKRSADVTIPRGENRGRTITYAQIVLDRQVIGMWSPKDGVSLRLPLHDVLVEGADGLAILVQADQDGLPGPVLGAASLSL